MAVSLKGLKRKKATLPPRVLFYSQPGMGKTTLANEFPETVFIQTEQGEGTDEINALGPKNGDEIHTSYNTVTEALIDLYQGDHTFKSVAIDSIDKLEPLVWRAVCEANKWDSIETPGYGKGYLAADEFWRYIVECLNALRIERGMNIILLGHSDVERFDDPRTTSYSRFDIRLHKRAQAIIEDEVDMIGFISQEASIKEEDAGFNKKRSHAEGGTARWIYTENRPSLNAKNRYSMPPKLIFKKGEGYAKLAPYFPSARAPGEAAPAIVPEAETQVDAVDQVTAADNTQPDEAKAAA